MVCFDLPTETKQDRKIYALFRKRLIKSGFRMFQFSIYIRHCPSRENAEVHQERVRRFLPERGSICMFLLTDKQFGMIELYHAGKKSQELPVNGQQLSLF